MRGSIAFILAAAGLAACAPTQEAAPGSQAATSGGSARQCFAPDRTTSFSRGGTDWIYVRAVGGGVFSVRAVGCPDVSSSPALLLSPTIGVSNRLCVGDSARITVANSSFGPPQCIARIEQSLTEAEIQALPSNQRP